MLEFIEEIKEARMFRSRETLNGKTAEELGQLLYIMFLMVEIMRNEQTKWTKDYIDNTMADEQFTSMRSNSTDLHNIIAVLANQDKFSTKIASNTKISPPLLQIKRYFRDIINDRKSQGNDRAFFKNLEDFLKIKNSTLKHLRRTVADWTQSSTTEKHTVKVELKNIVKPTNYQNDLVIKFIDKLGS